MYCDSFTYAQILGGVPHDTPCLAISPEVLFPSRPSRIAPYSFHPTFRNPPRLNCLALFQGDPFFVPGPSPISRPSRVRSLRSRTLRPCPYKAFRVEEGPRPRRPPGRPDPPPSPTDFLWGPRTQDGHLATKTSPSSCAARHPRRSYGRPGWPAPSEHAPGGSLKPPPSSRGAPALGAVLENRW